METAMNRKKGGKRLYQNVERRRNEATESKNSESSTSKKYSSGDDFDSNWYRNTWCGIGKNNVETVERNYSFLEKDENKFFVGTRGSEPSGLYEQNVRKMHDIDKQTKMFPRFIDFTSKCNVEHRSDVHNPSVSSRNTDIHGNNLEYSRKESNKLLKNRIHYNTNERDEQIWQQVISGSTDKLKSPVIVNRSSDTVHNTYSGESTHLFTSNFDSPILISDEYQSLNAGCVSSENTSKLKTSVSENWNSDSYNERHVSTSLFSHSVDPCSPNAVSVNSENTGKLKIPVSENWNSGSYNERHIGTGLFSHNIDPHSLNAVCVSSENTGKLKTSVSENWNSDSYNERCVSTGLFSHSVDPHSLNAVCVSSKNTSKLKTPVSENWNSDFYNERHVSTSLFSHNVDPHSLNAVSINSENTGKLKIPVSENWNSGSYNERHIGTGLFSHNIDPHSLNAVCVSSENTGKLKTSVSENWNSDSYNERCVSTGLFSHNVDPHSLNAVCVSSKNTSKLKTPFSENWNSDFYNERHVSTSLFSHNVDPHSLNAVSVNSENTGKLKIPVSENWNSDFYNERYVSTGLFSQNVNPHSLITKCLSEVTYWTDSCLANHGRELGKISFHVGRANDTEGILNTLRSRKTNMSSQQKCFHNFVQYVHNEMNELYNEYDSGVITRKTNELLSYTKDECKLFSNMSPAYSLKQELETALMSSQVTIISCDVMYRSNIVIPLLLRGTFSSGTIASCEVNEAVALFSAQNCCHIMDQKLGKLVGYDMEKEILGSKNTKIVYTTVQKLLSYTMDDPLLPKFSCVILNDFLYRSIEADILLTSLRECLNKRDDLKILILMVTKHNIENLKYFFSRKSGDVCVINTENLNFPIQTVWKKSFCDPDDDIILEAVDMCFAIHVSRLNEEGNVLVFLPTEEDALEVTELTTKKFCEYSFTDVFCTYVNEKNKVKKILQIQEQQQQSKRVIIFVKGGFEVVFFPNVHYVVDFGRTNQISYDTEKKIEVQKRSFISRSRSEIIKKCVGTYVSGICFRMYSKKNYKKSMVYNESPEVLRRSPLNSLVKIFKYRPDSTLPVRFVEPLSHQVNENALNALQSLGALENGKLTQLGKCLVKLPFPPEYSKLIIIGKQKGLLFEVIILVSFFLAEIGDIFQDKSTKDLQKKVDAAKLRFLQSDSDTLTFLNIYVQWIKNECSRSWCVDNYIEFNCLDCVRIKITEVCEIVKKILGETILQEFSNDYQITPDVCSSLQLIIFECFRDNLCVYSGHLVGGYRYPIAHCTVFLHPSTFIVEKRKLPQFIVYDKFISKTCNFITHVTAIPDSYVIDAFDRGLLKVKRFVLFDQKLVPHVIEPVGLSVIKCALTKEKLRDLEEQITRETKSRLIVIEPFIEKASVTLYCLPDNWGKAEKIMRKFLDENIEKFWEEEEIQVLEFRKGDTTVLVNIVWSKGAEISSVEVAHQDTTLDSQSESSRDICFRQTTTSPSGTNATQSCILLTWLRRPCVGDGFVEFNNFEDFSRARRLALRTIQVRGASAEVEVSQHEKYRLSVHHLCPETTEQDLKVAFQELLVGISPSDVKVRRRSPFKTTSDDIECIEKSFREQIHCIFGRNVIKIKIHEPENNEEVIMSAEVRPIGSCMNMFSLENLAVFMNGSLKVHDVSVKAEVSYFSLLFCSTEVWDKIQPSICSLYNAYVKELRMNDQNCDLEAKALDSQTQRLKISSENEANVIELRKIIQNRLEGCIITSADNNYLPMLFCHGGQVFLDALKNRTNVHVVDDYKTKTLRLYGAEENCEVARHDIMEYLSQMKVETVKIVSLDRGKSSRTLLKNIIQTYDVELKQFIEVCQLRSAELDIKKCELTLHGSAESIEEAEALLEKLEESESDSTSSTVSDEETCPICLSGVFTHGIRLESCGHLFCRICCQRTMQKPKFPVQCSFPGCGKAIILEDIRRTLDYNEEMIKEVLRKSLRKFLDDHNNFAYCPAPDCTMFVNKETITDTKWKCQLCHNDICLDCRVIYHEGYSCDMYQKMKIDPDHQFRVWQENNQDCKQCPACGNVIQKVSGCNHMTCGSCKAEFYWNQTSYMMDKINQH